MTDSETLRKMRLIVVEGDSGACGPGCLEDALSRVAFGRSWWTDDAHASEQQFIDTELHHQTNLRRHPLYARLLQKGNQLFPKLAPFEPSRKVWAISDRVGKLGRIAILDALLAEAP